MMKINVLFITVCFFLQSNIFAQNISIPFDTEKWDKTTAKGTEFLGQKCLMGIATLKDVEFTNGVIEFDLAVNGERSYPGVTFRAKRQTGDGR